MRPLRLVVAALVVAGCADSGASDDAASAPPSDAASAMPSAAASVDMTPSSTPSTAPSPSAPAEPRALFGTWRTTLAGEPLSLNITETTYRIVRGANAANGSVTVTGDQIEFFDSDLCPGSGVYRWAISEEGALSFFPVVTEPCPGRAEAVLVRYTDYSPPSGG